MALSLSRPLSPELRRSLRHGGFFLFWQIQSKLAAIVMLALVAIDGLLAIATVLAWSFAAACIYHAARQRGVPDLLQCPSSRGSQAMRTGQLLGRVWLAGLNAYVYANVLRPVLSGPSRAGRAAVLAAGLILFGVTTSRHMLQCAGLRDSKLLAATLAGTCLNVPYRVFCSALTLHLMLELLNVGMPRTYV